MFRRWLILDKVKAQREWLKSGFIDNEEDEVKSDQEIKGNNYCTLRPVPSAGARHPFETYVAVNKVNGATVLWHISQCY